jgi:predicted lactoylglutathione lyase
MEPTSSRKIFVNLPVSDLRTSVDFFTYLGFEFNAHFTDENATAMVIREDVFVMLLVKPFFATFTRKQVADAATHTEVVIALSVGSRQQVDDMADKALAAGGQPSNDPMDQGSMYGRSFQDLDGHLWEVMYLDPDVAIP